MAKAARDPIAIAEDKIEEAQRTSAVRLDLSRCGLVTLPEAIGQVTSLQELYLSDNHLTALPEAIGQLTSLQRLWLTNNQLTALPEAIGRLTDLQKLFLAYNQLTALPDAIGRLTNLIKLYLERNQLTALPETIGRLTSLQELRVQDNQLTALPESISQLSSLQKLWLHDNESLGIPPDILGPTVLDARWRDRTPTPPAQILAYYFRTRTASRPLNEAKVILVGRGEVGKTSLVSRLIRDEFNPGEPKTHGINIIPWKGKRRAETLTLHVWDFGGQEIMHATHQFFFTERALYLLVLNGRQGQEDAEAEYWLELIRNFGGNSPVLVIMNKVAQHPFDVNRSSLQARFLNIKGFIHTDCAERIGLKELRQAIAREVKRSLIWVPSSRRSGSRSRSVSRPCRRTARTTSPTRSSRRSAPNSARRTRKARTTSPGFFTRLASP